jgi:hypothetical protein
MYISGLYIINDSGINSVKKTKFLIIVMFQSSFQL